MAIDLTHEACSWPEQDAVDAWLAEHKIDVPFATVMALKVALTAWRVQMQNEAADTIAGLTTERDEARRDSALKHDWRIANQRAEIARLHATIAALRAAPVAMRERAGIYIASKAKYGGEWLAMRAAGYPVSATWIDQFEPGSTEDWPTLWTGCIDEAKSSSALVLICRPGDVLKGAFVEAGAALAFGVPVFAVGIEDYSIRHHPGVTECETEAQAFEAAIRALPLDAPAPVDPVAEAARVLLEAWDTLPTAVHKAFAGGYPLYALKTMEQETRHG